MNYPSGFLPLIMSMTALGIVLGHAAIYGVAHGAGADTAARLSQILMAGQIPMVARFAIKWLPQGREEALLVLLLQAGAGITVLTSVYFLT
jgi:hypothetical protein